MDSNDSHVDVPSLIMPTLDIMAPLTAPAPTGTNNEASFETDYISTHNNAAAFGDNIIDIAPGAWEVRISFAINQVIATAVTISSVMEFQLGLVPGAITFSINLSRFVVVTGNQRGQDTWRFLLRDPARVQFQGPATAVGDTIIIWSSLVFTKLI